MLSSMFLNVTTREPSLAEGSRVKFDYEIRNEAGDLLTEGYTLMVFVSLATGRPVPIPDGVHEKLAPHFQVSVIGEQLSIHPEEV